jgi:V/A-type H+-transporting ATPase subunit K
LTARRTFRRSFAIVTLATLAVMFAIAFSAHSVFGQAQTQTTTTAASNNGLGLIAAALAITGSCFGAGYAVAKAASAAAAAIVERPGAFGPMLVLAGLGEGIAIYGLLVAFQILSKI